MILSLFSRKTLPTPSPSRDSVPPPSASPSPPPALPADPANLRSLIEAVPANSLHAYILTHLAPDAPPISYDTLTTLTTFFSSLSPPPRLHCVRCHKQYFDVENTDWSCLVPHDDDSAEVERVGWARTTSAEYQTLWACCGRTVEGAGDMGPPDGWCYEGKHTTDIKRARFRADSSPYDDKLIPCVRMGCSGQPTLPSSPIPVPPANAHSPRGRKRAYPAPDEQQVTDSEDDSHVEHAVIPLSRKQSIPHVVMTKRSPTRSGTKSAAKPKSSSASPRVARTSKPRSDAAKLRSTSPKSCPKPVSMRSTTSCPVGPTCDDTNSNPTVVRKITKRRKVV